VYNLSRNRIGGERMTSLLERLLKRPLQQITLYWEGGDTTTYIVAGNDVQRFVKASLELYYKPGKNPHSGLEAGKVVKITAQSLSPTGPYWWSTPGLKDNNDPNGAVIWEWGFTEEILWEHPEKKVADSEAVGTS